MDFIWNIRCDCVCAPLDYNDTRMAFRWEHASMTNGANTKVWNLHAIDCRKRVPFSLTRKGDDANEFGTSKAQTSWTWRKCPEEMNELLIWRFVAAHCSQWFTRFRHTAPFGTPSHWNKCRAHRFVTIENRAIGGASHRIVPDARMKTKKRQSHTRIGYMQIENFIVCIRLFVCLLFDASSGYR